jgi:hypothetical protein
MTTTAEVEISDDLIKAAEEALAQYPKTVAQQLEKWIYLGKAASLQLTERDAMNLQLGNGSFVFVPEKGS